MPQEDEFRISILEFWTFDFGQYANVLVPFQLNEPMYLACISPSLRRPPRLMTSRK